MPFDDSKVNKVSISIDISVPEIIKFEKNEEWLQKNHAFKNDDGSYVLEIAGPTKDFKRNIGQMGLFGCNQDFISCLKYARDAGAHFVVMRK